MFRILLPLLLILNGCSAALPKQPDLQKAFEGYKYIEKKEPLIFIPGLFGSMLVNEKGDVIWGRRSSIFNYRTINRDLLLPIAGTSDVALKHNLLQPYRLLESLVWVRDILEIRAVEQFINTLEGIGGYRLGDIEHPTREDNFYIFVYDWRQDNAKHAAALHDKITAIKEAWEDPNLKVNIVAHSMGGLIARYYLKYGNRDLLDLDLLPPPTFAGSKNVNKLITVGTPSLGSMGVTGILHYGLPMWHLRPRLNPETMLTWPSMYQLLPSQPHGLFLDENKNPVKDFDIYDIKSWEKYKLGIFSQNMMNRLRRHYSDQTEERAEQIKAFMPKALERAKRFHMAIERDEDKDNYQTTRIIAFGGDCLLTPEYAIIGEDGRFDIDRDDLNVPGDGRVTRTSLLGTESQILTNPNLFRTHVHHDFAMFICESHGALPDNETFRDNLLHMLLNPIHYKNKEGN